MSLSIRGEAFLIPRFKKIQFEKLDKDLIDRFQSNVDTVISTLPTITILDGQLLKNIKLDSSAPNSVLHKLGRELIGYIIVGKSANCDIWDSQNANTLKDKYLILNCTSDVTVNLWVF